MTCLLSKPSAGLVLLIVEGVEVSGEGSLWGAVSNACLMTFSIEFNSAVFELTVVPLEKVKRCADRGFGHHVERTSWLVDGVSWSRTE